MTDPTLTVSLPTRALRTAVGEVPPGVQIVDWDMASAPPVADIDLVVAPYMNTGASVLGRLTGLPVRLVQSQSIGYDGVADYLPEHLVFANANANANANASSVHEPSTAELTVALILASQRGIPDFVRAAAEGRWAPAIHPSLADRTVLIIGYGGVGRAIESRLLAFETTIVRVASTARTDEHGQIHGVSEIAGLLPSADIVVLAVPLSDTTTGMVDDPFLSLMRDGSLLVNIARGPVVDTDSLLKHVSTGRLRAALDVTEPEPLPQGHPLFALPNVLISPHVGGATSAMMPRMARLVHTQIDRMLRGEEPLNVVLRT
ncbi:2-hydroxyacid dehydrogenase [Glaciihabitans sp. dw_435]|uniref:2-hydroxyacid dehydrogenase n=1 Tax=Glaciihabitans sp. dw_435 TaxID=2720081 RepID=UPI0027DBFFD4|nr:2-hydroxyacid dehydrogenase [Glaciihabitans sp. dw_435]